MDTRLERRLPGNQRGEITQWFGYCDERSGTARKGQDWRYRSVSVQADPVE